MSAAAAHVSTRGRKDTHDTIWLDYKSTNANINRTVYVAAADIGPLPRLDESTAWIPVNSTDEPRALHAAAQVAAWPDIFRGGSTRRCHLKLI